MSSSGQIRNLLILIAASVSAGILLAAGMSYYYGPDGSYRASQILIHPKNIGEISFTDKQENFRFERVEFLYFKNNEWVREKLNQETYQKIYSLISADKSIMQATESFEEENPAILTIVAIHEKQPQLSRVFQEIQFSPKDDYYRIKVKSDSPDIKWVYFYHPGLYQKTIKASGPGNG